MIQITRRDNHVSKSGKAYAFLHYFDSESGRAGRVLASPSYADRLQVSQAQGIPLHVGYNKSSRSEFLYAK